MVRILAHYLSELDCGKDLRDFVQKHDTRGPFARSTYVGGARLLWVRDALEGNCSHIGVLVYYGTLPAAVLTKLTMITLS